MTRFALIRAHSEYVRQAGLIDKMLYALDQYECSSELLEMRYASLMDRARDIRKYLNA